jgi:hypothetical protein
MKRLARGCEPSGFVGIVAGWPLAVDLRVMLCGCCRWACLISGKREAGYDRTGAFPEQDNKLICRRFLFASCHQRMADRIGARASRPFRPMM